MKIELLKVRNYRSYSGEHVIRFDPGFTSFIGKNDSGKSSIFDALDVFAGNKKPDLGDLCINGNDKFMEISVTFSDIPREVSIDDNAVTNLKDEYLLNEEGNLEIKKIFKCNARSVSNPEVYIVTNYPDIGQVEILHKLNNKGLKELGKSMSISVEDEKVNNLWRKAIWSQIRDLRIIPTDLKIEDFDAKAKKIYSKLEEYMPLIFVFRADREMTDAESEARDPMQMAVAEAQMDLEKEISEIQEKIQERVDSVATLALEKLREMHPTLAEELNPVHKSKPTWKFDYRIEDDRGVPLNKRGSGTRRLVLLNFFRAQAEKKCMGSDRGVVYAIEEPETSQHPDNQILVMQALSTLAGDPLRQVMITTHSPELLEEIVDKFCDGIRFIQSNEDEEREVEYGKNALILSADTLGILSKQMFGSAEKVILVEGRSDCLFLEHTAQAMKESGELKHDFSDFSIETLPVGGCSGVRDWIRMKKLKSLGLKSYVFLDSDRESESDDPTANEELIENLNKENDAVNIAFYTKKRAIENYITQEISGCKFGEYENAKSIISIARNIDKNKIISTYWPKMSADDIDQEIKDLVKSIIEN